MIRLTIALAAVVVFAPLARTAVTPGAPKKMDRLSTIPPTATKEEPRTARVVSPPPAPPADELMLTSRSEVLLDGKPVSYSAIPRGARVTHVEVAPNGRTILRIQFRSR
ncbi:MAG: hypothetical protein U0736_10760 [Gemmataceae bacterium]